MSPPERAAAGFSIVELLIVVLILAVLSGLAINTYLSRKADALDRQAWGDLRNNVVIVESYFVENSTYVGAPGDRGFVESVGITISLADAPHTTVNRFCIDADHEDIDGAGTIDWHYSNMAGSVRRGPCS